MQTTPKELGKRVRQARHERGYTQKDLAEHLGKTAAAISELERGKISVNASDLARLSFFLDKPIEYFYGVEYGTPEAEDLIALVRALDEPDRKQLLSTIDSIYRMQQLSKIISKTTDKQELSRLLQQFYEVLQPFIANITDLQTSGIEAQEKLRRLIEDPQ